MLSDAIAQIIPIRAGDDDILESHRSKRRRKMNRLLSVGCERAAVSHVAERAAARAQVAENHERRGSFPEALTDIRAGGFFAHRMQLVLAQNLLDFMEPLAGWCLYANPVRLL